MNKRQQTPPVPPPLPQQGQPMPQYSQRQMPNNKKKRIPAFLYVILAIVATILIMNIKGKHDVQKIHETQAAKDSVFIDQVDSILQVASVKNFNLNLERLFLISLGDNSKVENKKLAAENGIRAGKLLDSKETEWRNLYAKKLKNDLWEHNVEVEVSGKTITFIGGMFADNGNIKQFQESVSGTLTLLGFKQVRYKWIKHADKFTYYDL